MSVASKMILKYENAPAGTLKGRVRLMADSYTPAGGGTIYEFYDNSRCFIGNNGDVKILN